MRSQEHDFAVDIAGAWYYISSMKTKTSITLTSTLLQGLDEHAAEFRSRSDFIEAAIEHYIAYLERQAAERRDLEIINRRADALNKEAEDVLSYQVPI